MSTRAQIKVTDGNDNVLFYRHSDGYPTGALPTLRKYMSRVASGMYRNNVEQSAGWLISLGSKERGYSHNKKAKSYYAGNEWKVGAIELACGMYSDIEYFYILDLCALTITVQKVSLCNGSKTTIDTIKF